MQRHRTMLLLIIAILLSLFTIHSSISSQATADQGKHPQTPLLPETPGIVNVDGDVSLREEQNRNYWNPHTTGLTDASAWAVTFNNETEISLRTTSNEAGHVATGAWWTTGFKTNKKLDLYGSGPLQVVASFRANVAALSLQSGQEWLRIAFACAVQRFDGSVVYTETDFWDSPNALAAPSGNVKTGGNIVYRGGDVVEYKIDQAAIGEWKNYFVDLTRHIDSAWSLKSGDVLESAYIVVEIIGEVSVTVKIDDFWLTKLN